MLYSISGGLPVSCSGTQLCLLFWNNVYSAVTSIKFLHSNKYLKTNMKTNSTFMEWGVLNFMHNSHNTNLTCHFGELLQWYYDHIFIWKLLSCIRNGKIRRIYIQCTNVYNFTCNNGVGVQICTPSSWWNLYTCSWVPNFYTLSQKRGVHKHTSFQS